MTADPTAFVLGGSGGLRRRELGAVRTWVGLGVVAVLVAIPLRGLYRFTGGTMEEGFMLYFPERMSKGDVPNVDFLHLYGPGSLHVLTGWYELFGNTLAAERTFGLLQHVAIIFGLFTLARPWGRIAATVVAGFAVFYVLTPIGLTAMAWNGGLALTLWCAVFAVRSTHGGRSFAVAHPTRRRRPRRAGPDVPPRPRPRRRRRDRLAGVDRAGVVAGGDDRSTRRAHAAVGAPGRRRATQRRGRAWSSTRSSTSAPAGSCPDRRRGIASTAPSRRSPSRSRRGGGSPTCRASNAIFLWFFAMLAGTVALLSLALFERRRGRRDGRAAVLLVVALVSVGILPQALQRPDSTHLTWVTCVSWPFAVVAVADVVQRRWPRATMRRAVAVGAAFTLVLTYVLTSLFTFRYYVLHTRAGYGWVPATFEINRDGRNFYFGAPRAALASQQVIDDLDGLARPGDRLFVGPVDLSRTWYSDAVFYWLFPEMEPATYFIEMDPGLANADDSRLADDLATADFVILTAFWAGWHEPNASMDFGSAEPERGTRRALLPVPPVPGRPRPPLLPLPLTPPHPSVSGRPSRHVAGHVTT